MIQLTADLFEDNASNPYNSSQECQIAKSVKNIRGIVCDITIGDLFGMDAGS